MHPQLVREDSNPLMRPRPAIDAMSEEVVDPLAGERRARAVAKCIAGRV